MVKHPLNMVEENNLFCCSKIIKNLTFTMVGGNVEINSSQMYHNGFPQLPKAESVRIM